MEESPIAQPPPPPLPPQRAATSARGFIVSVAIFFSLAVLGGFIGYSEWKAHQPSMDGLTTKVMDSMNQSLRRDEDFRDLGLRVKSITIMRVTGNMFEGQAVAATRKGDDHNVTVHIGYDGEAMFWRTENGAFLFAAREQLGGP